MDESAKILFLLLSGHAVADFALQTDWIAVNKERPRPEQGGTSTQTQTIWPYVLAAHSLHHGLFVFLITQKLSLGVAETLVHALSDFGKGERWYGFHTDQWIHITSKFLWTITLAKGWA